jgi:dienelactone hydrolase
VDGKRLGLVGGSRGAELALLVASMEPRIRSVVATTPSSHAWGGRTTAGSAWTSGGKEVPFLALGLTADAPQVKRFEASLDQARKDAAARIPVEKINGPILLISATEDAIWPSFRMSLDIESTLRDAHFPYEVRHASYRTGHGFSQETAPRIKKTIVDHFVDTL